MPVTIKLDPQTVSLQSQIIPDASCFNDGVMSKAQACKLQGLVPGGSKAFKYAVAQPADDSDFIVTIPAAVAQPSPNYMVTPVIGTANVFTGIAIDSATLTQTTFRVTTDAVLPDGTIIYFSVEQLA